MFCRITFLLTALSIFLFGCGDVSEEEIQARRDNAFDISGSWQTTEDSEVQLNFEITNQTAKHDILVTLTRTSPLTEEEKSLFSDSGTEHGHGIASDNLLNPPIQITLGEKDPYKGYPAGDNISDNLGKTNQFHVCTTLEEYASIKKHKA